MMPARSNLADRRHAPAYTPAEAAHYLGVPLSTVRSWVRGQSYAGGRKFFKPLIPCVAPGMLSFVNLVELHVLAAITREFKIPLQKVRLALDYLAKNSPSAHPLAEKELEASRLDLFMRTDGKLITVSESGQQGIKKILDPYLRRIDRDRLGQPIRLYPFTTSSVSSATKSVVVDPHVSFGRPVLAGTGVPTAVIAERFKAGDSYAGLAKDYGLTIADIEEAIRCELSVEAA